jgi:hypothetical protein
MRKLNVAVVFLSFVASVQPFAIAQKTFSHIQNMTKWESCDVCSGADGAGSTAVYWQAQFQTTPSLSGSATEFHYGGTDPYSSVLWWEPLGSYPSYSHFIYELDFYLTNDTRTTGAGVRSQPGTERVQVHFWHRVQFARYVQGLLARVRCRIALAEHGGSLHRHYGEEVASPEVGVLADQRRAYPLYRGDR